MSLIPKRITARHTSMIVVLVLLGFALPAEAVIIKKFSFTGRVAAIENDSGGTPLPGVAINDTITGVFAYDIDTLPGYTNPASTTTTYGGALVEFSLKLGSYEGNMVNPGFVVISNNFDYGPSGVHDAFTVGTGLGNLAGTGPLPPSYATINLLAGTGYLS